MRILVAYGIGLIFGLGIVISGMANPAKVLNFFDLAGSWDGSLALVMGSALLVTAIGYRMILPKPSKPSPAPLMETGFQVPMNRRLDAKLIGGSALFGVGWGIAGFCPGGSLPALGTGRWEVIVFTLALLAGVFAAKKMMKFTQAAGDGGSVRA